MKLHFDDDGLVFVSAALQLEPDAMRPCASAILCENTGSKLLGGVVWHEYRKFKHGATCEFSGALMPGVTVTRGAVEDFFLYPFRYLKVTRLQASTPYDNQKARKFLRKLGFQFEGILRRAHDGRRAAVVFSMLPEECPWLKGRHGKKR